MGVGTVGGAHGFECRLGGVEGGAEGVEVGVVVLGVGELAACAVDGGSMRYGLVRLVAFRGVVAHRAWRSSWHVMVISSGRWEEIQAYASAEVLKLLCKDPATPVTRYLTSFQLQETLKCLMEHLYQC